MFSIAMCKARPEEWDAFTKICRGSFRCLYHSASYWKFETEFPSKIVRLDIIAEEAGKQIKIGQCALSIGRHFHVFHDSLQILPAHRHNWTVIMLAVLRYLGEGHYIYGSDWNLDSCRAEDIASIAGATLEHRHPVDVMSIEFSDWDDWNSYYKSVSKNAKRNAEKATKIYSSLNIETRTGSACLLDVLPLQLARVRLFRRKNINLGVISLLARTAARVLATSHYCQTKRLVSDVEAIAYYLGINLGPVHYFIESASDNNSNGASAYLLKSVIQAVCAQHGQKCIFVFGPDDHSHAGDPIWEGLARSRQQWRAKPFPTSIVRFRYSGTCL